MKTFLSLPKGANFDTFFTKENIALLESLGEVIWNPTEKQMLPEEIADAIGDSDAYITLWGSPRLDETILQKAPKVKLLTHLAGTVVPFVSDAMWDRGIRAISGNDYFAESVAEGTLAYMLAALRDIPMFSRRLKEERIWKQPDDFTRGLAGKTVGIISYGAIAKYLVRLLSAFRVKIKIYDIVPLPEEDVARYGLEQASLEEIFSTCDIISIHTPLFEATHHLINGNLLSMIKEGALLINTARGGVIDQIALEEELETGRFRAVLDVYDPEPPTKYPTKLFDLPNVMMLPHQGGPTTDLRAFITRELILESAAFIDEGKPLLHEITRERAKYMSAH
jgi:phosphoglycerate dehydrogenase-like enzyme